MNLLRRLSRSIKKHKGGLDNWPNRIHNVYNMRIITRKRLEEYWKTHRTARNWLGNWHDAVREAQWKNLHGVRQTFPHADAVQVASKKTATIFNACGGNFRLVTAIHYNRGCVFVLWFGTHAEYDKDTWKAKL